MPRFYFDTDFRGEVHRDEEGQEFADSAALQDAKLGAAEYVADIIARGGTPDHEQAARHLRGHPHCIFGRLFGGDRLAK